ncbi:unnamed protein product [Prunus armeniaca]|uniref:Uncharacterized protein n=1 Tax=Prunus armeniaca TaxID=36596 RepID=A0A6J5WH52_PRUAR|nr:unnamed protein product [Prunus armeniaca]
MAKVAQQKGRRTRRGRHSGLSGLWLRVREEEPIIKVPISGTMVVWNHEIKGGQGQAREARSEATRAGNLVHEHARVRCGGPARIRA